MNLKLLVCLLCLWASGCACSNRFGVQDLREWDFAGHHYRAWNQDRLFAWSIMGCGHYEYLETDGKVVRRTWTPDFPQ